MPDMNEMPTWQKIGLFLSAFAVLMAVITAAELRETSKSCVLRPR